MEVQQLAPGLWRWVTRYGEWNADVGCVFVESDDAIVLIDPLVPEEAPEEARFWRALDRDVRRAGVPVHVLVTVYWHARSAGIVTRRYDGRLHAVSGARSAIARRTDDGITDVYKIGATLPGGIETLPSGRRSEVVFWIPEHRTLVPGDVILGGSDGTGLRLCPESWFPETIGHDAMKAALRPLADLPVERVLVSHGNPVLTGARAEIRRILRA